MCQKYRNPYMSLFSPLFTLRIISCLAMTTSYVIESVTVPTPFVQKYGLSYNLCFLFYWAYKHKKQSKKERKNHHDRKQENRINCLTSSGDGIGSAEVKTRGRRALSEGPWFYTKKMMAWHPCDNTCAMQTHGTRAFASPVYHP